MLGDLRIRLEAVDRLEIQDSLGDRALAYFDGLPESQLTSEELSRRVQAITQIGGVRYARPQEGPTARAARRPRPRPVTG